MYGDVDLKATSPTMEISGLDGAITQIDEKNFNSVGDATVKHLMFQDLLQEVFGVEKPQPQIQPIPVQDEFLKSAVRALLPAVETIVPTKPNAVTDSPQRQ